VVKKSKLWVYRGGMKVSVRRLVAVFALASALAALVSARAEEAAGIVWRTQPSEASREARVSRKPVLVDVWASWCIPCKATRSTTFRDPRVVQAARSFVPVRLDVETDERFLQMYRDEGFPTVLFLDDEGDEIARLVGTVPASRLLEAMEIVRAGYSEYLNARDRRRDPGALAAVASYLSKAGNPAGATVVLRRAIRLLGRGDMERRRELELYLAEAELDKGHAKAAARTFGRLADDAGAPVTRARALAGLSRAEMARGKDRLAEAAAQRLRQEYPEMAERLLGGTR
jgi:thioredoxin-like negative regulator of GroEL